MTSEKGLSRFLEAQKGDFSQALSEIISGRKRTHWMWYIFPQLKGLGRSSTSEFYGIKDLSEAGDYLAHPVLGSRLTELSTELLRLKTSDANAIFGSPDDLKLKSSMTLFANVPGAPPLFQQVLEKFFGGSQDEKTIELLQS